MTVIFISFLSMCHSFNWYLNMIEERSTTMPNDKLTMYSVVIPVYNGEKTISPLCVAIREQFNRLNLPYEIILIDDGSGDDSWEIMQNIRKSDHHVKIVRLMRNFGQQNAILCGFKYTMGDFVITMDDDLQHPPAELPKLINAMNDDVDVVIGALAEKQDTRIKKWGSSLIRYLNGVIFKIPKTLKLSSFRIIRRTVVNHMVQTTTPYPYISGLLFSFTDRVSNTPVEHHPRTQGQSNYNFRKLVRLAFNLIINYSSIPLRLLTFFGMLVSIGAFTIGGFFLIKKMIVGSSIQGWTSTIVLLSFFNGILLAVLSVIGEYLARILGEISNRPSAIIREKLM